MLASGEPVTTVAVDYFIAGCPLPESAGGPCVSGRWLAGADRILAAGVSLAVDSSPSICTPTGTALNVVHTQERASAR